VKFKRKIELLGTSRDFHRLGLSNNDWHWGIPPSYTKMLTFHYNGVDFKKGTF